MDIVIKDLWGGLKCFTDARIALGRTGASLPTAEYLQFKLDHARAKDAVRQPFDREALAAELQAMGLDIVQVDSRTDSRTEYLARPDKGRQLAESSADKLNGLSYPADGIAIVVGDGLSSTAIRAHAVPFLRHFLPYVRKWESKVLLPVLIAGGARVALGDEIGQLLHARLVIMLIGERPGLSSPDSMGIYLTWEPCLGRLDAERNCISNVRPQGLDYTKAAFKLAWLVEHAFTDNCTGICLKDMSDIISLSASAEGDEKAG